MSGATARTFEQDFTIPISGSSSNSGILALVATALITDDPDSSDGPGLLRECAGLPSRVPLERRGGRRCAPYRSGAERDQNLLSRGERGKRGGLQSGIPPNKAAKRLRRLALTRAPITITGCLPRSQKRTFEPYTSRRVKDGCQRGRACREGDWESVNHEERSAGWWSSTHAVQAPAQLRPSDSARFPIF